MAALVLLGLGYAAWVLSRPAPVRISFATSLTGPSAPAGNESLIATKLYLDEVNAKGGVHGRAVELLLFDDASTADGARANVDAIAASSAVAVLGHYLSTASLAASPGYRAAKMPALTGTSFVDDLTTDNEWYFRAQTTSSVQGRSIAEYLRVVMKAPKVRLIYSEDRFGQNFFEGFLQGYVSGGADLSPFDVGATRDASIGWMLDELVLAPEPAVIVIGTGADHLPEVIKGVRRRGIKAPVIAAGGAGSEEFLGAFADEPEEKQQPGFFSKNLYASPPLIFDSAGAAAQAFEASFLAKAATPPGWIAAGAYDAAQVMVEALRRANIHNRPETKQSDREAVRAALAGMDSPKNAVAGLSRPLYFDFRHDMPSPVRLGFFRNGRFVTAPMQLVRIENPEQIDLGAEREKGRVVSFGDRHYWRQRVVYTGIDINRLNRMDVKAGTFNADFYLWMRFAGEDDAPTRVEFPALLDRGAFDPGKPLQSGFEEGLNYRLYRINADFKTHYDLHDYPFDTQQLTLKLQNAGNRRELITYVIDRFGLRLSDEKSSYAQDGAYSGLELWRFLRLRYFVESLASRSTLGKASLFDTDVRTEFAGFDAGIVLRRNSAIYLLKNLIPLLLLVLVVFATLFFPETLFRERITIPVTAILTSAVLLVAVNSQIGDVGYTVLIEQVFYVFFALCLMAMVTGFAHEQVRQRGNEAAATLMDHTAQLVYAATVCVVVALVWWRHMA